MEVFPYLVGLSPLLPWDGNPVFPRYLSPPGRLKMIRKSGRSVGMHAAMMTVLISFLDVIEGMRGTNYE